MSAEDAYKVIRDVGGRADGKGLKSRSFESSRYFPLEAIVNISYECICEHAVAQHPGLTWDFVMTHRDIDWHIDTLSLIREPMREEQYGTIRPRHCARDT